MAVFWSGLSGAFLLDDTPNLNVIAQLPANPSLSDILNLATTGFAGILGRSVSILSFLLQYESWPDPRNFKFVNLLIHLCNGALIALFCVLVGRQSQARAMPIIGVAAISFVWLVHPIQVSAVLYVVQRMTLLSAMFSLLSLIFYLLGRQLLVRQENAKGIALILLGLLPVALLAVLSKENGALVYLYILALEYTLFASDEQPKILMRIRQSLLAGTVLFGIVGLVLIMPSTLEGYELKPFSFSERVFTQFPVLTTYIASIALLLPNYFGVFHDDFANGGGITLALSVLFIAGLLAVAFLKRKQWPLFSFAIIWFFAGHALESTILPLEFYFEHRNYLPLLGPVFALVVFLSDALPRLEASKRSVALALITVALVFMSSVTVKQTELWGDALKQAYASVEQHPDSARAQSNLVEKLSSAGQFQEAFDYHMTIVESERQRIGPYIRWLEFSCILPSVTPPLDQALTSRAREALHDFGAIFSLNNLVFGIVEGRCPSASVSKLQLLLDGLVENSSYAVSSADLFFFKALLEASSQNFAAAATLAASSYDLRSDVLVGLYQVNWLARSEQTSSAAELLDTLLQDFELEVASSEDLSSRVEFLQNRIQEAEN